MLTRSGLKQAFRTPRRLIAYFLVTAVVCAFLCIGLNLKQAADKNLQTVVDNFNIVALPDFKARVTRDGTLSNDPAMEDCIGYFQTWAENYDLEAIASLPGVKSIDSRNKFAACVAYPENTPSEIYWRKNHFWDGYSYDDDVVIFQLNTSGTVTIPEWQQISEKRWASQLYSFPAKIFWSAAGRDLSVNTLSVYTSREPFTLEPGVTYIMNIGDMVSQGQDYYHFGRKLEVTENGAFRWNDDPDYGSGYVDQYPFCVEYTDGFWETETGLYFRQATEAVMLNANSVTAVTTSDLEAIPAFLNGHVYISEGRAFTEEEYNNGEKVCIISKNIAEHLNWKIGDTLDLSFFETDYLFSRTMKGQLSYYMPSVFVSDEDWAAGQLTDFPLDHIFDTGTFTIIGIYDGNICRGDDDGPDYAYNESMSIQMVLFPEKSIQNQPDVKLSQYMTTIRLEPLMLQKFLAAAQSSGLMDEKAYGYQLGLTVEDYGLTGMITGLESLQEISRLTLMLAAITAALAVLVLSILHLLYSRRQIAVLRSMGVKKYQVIAWVLAGVVLTCILGAVLGAWVGQQMSLHVTQRILDNAAEDTIDEGFSGTIIEKEDDKETFQMDTASDPFMTWLAGGLVIAAFLLFSLVLVQWEANKPPLLMLGVKE